MKRSKSAEKTLLEFYEKLSKKDVASFDKLVSAQEGTLVIGTAPGEIVTERKALRFGFETEGISLVADEPVGYEDGSVAWVVDQPLFGFPDGSKIKVRLTAVMHQEDKLWKITHAHFSLGVPDEEAGELYKKWSSA